MELDDAGAHQRVGRQGVGAVAAAVDDEDVETLAGEEHRGGRAGSASADDDDVVNVGAWSWAVLVTQRGRRPADVGRRCGGHEGGVVAHAVDEVRVAAVLMALPDDVEAGDGGDAAALHDLAVRVEHRDRSHG